jgi:molybdopterin converting factor subunit 1
VRIRLLHFASFRDAAGVGEQEREVPEGVRVSELWAALSREVPLFSRFPSMPPAAVNLEYMAADTVLHEGDEVAFLPPVAGG